MEEIELSEQCRLGNNQARKNCMNSMRAYAWHLSTLYRRPGYSPDLLHDGFF